MWKPLTWLCLKLIKYAYQHLFYKLNKYVLISERYVLVGKLSYLVYGPESGVDLCIFFNGWIILLVKYLWVVYRFSDKPFFAIFKAWTITKTDELIE